ncbi:MAG TPA: PbrT family lead (Pb2+) uptake porter [Acidimicrobiaceae bacterium]|nr:PbrT family lead (Pb2+) uptake porter [Acidimicrobiaceae bacterium]
MTRSITALVVAPLALVALACTDNEASSEAGAVAVTSTNNECNVDAAEAPSGNLVFDVKNEGDQVTEFYLLADDGLRIVGEVENIGPGLTRQLVVTAGPGSYFTACKPGMVGDGIRAPFTVTDSGEPVGPTGEIAQLLATATTQYASYVKDQAAQLIAKTEEFAALYVAGDDDAARTLYADARTHWERIEPVAESFGDLDPRLDLREADLVDGEAWTGWHRIEKDLWPPAEGYTALTDDERVAMADMLVADTQELVDRVQDLSFTADQLGNGAKELLDEVATGKVTGEEEIWSHTDLWDFQANVDGARIAFEVLEPALRTKDDALADLLTTRFAELQTLLDQYRDGDGFVLYTDLTADQVKELSDAVNALSEPLSQLTAAVVL